MLCEKRKMKFKVIILLLLMTIVTVANTPRHTSVDPIIQPYVDTLFKLTKGRIGQYYAIGFEDIPEERVLANCRMTLISGDISFDRDSWDSSSDRKRLLILAHELGLEHKPDNRDVNDCPKHIMGPVMGSDTCVATKFYDYIRQISEK